MAKAKTDSFKHRRKQVMRPDAGMEPHVKAGNKRKGPVTYRYDSSLAPEMAWDENPAREMAEWLIGVIAQAGEDGGAAFKPNKKGEYNYPTWKGGGGLLQVNSGMRREVAGTFQTIPQLVGQG